MAEITHVQPGDLITAELMNAIIDALHDIDARADDFLERVARLPQEPATPFITSIDPPAAVAGQMVDIKGGGFIPDPDASKNDVTADGMAVTEFGTVTRSVIQAKVPELRAAEGSRVSVVVKNPNGRAQGTLIFGPAIDVGFVPTPPEVVELMLKLAAVTKVDVVYDLGSGDGRIVIMAAEKFGARGVGVDADPQRIREAQQRAQQANVADRVKFIQGDLFAANLSDATVITLHLLPNMNLKLRPALERLNPGTRIVSHQFDMGDWTPARKETITLADGEHTVYLWNVGR